jgi:hypothetical protein
MVGVPADLVTVFINRTVEILERRAGLDESIRA